MWRLAGFQRDKCLWASLCFSRGSLLRGSLGGDAGAGLSLDGFGIQCWAKIGFMDNLGFVFKGVCSGGEGIPGLLLRFQRTTLFQLELEFS
jgi:hypothetical protein